MNKEEFVKEHQSFGDWDDLINWDCDSRGYDQEEIIDRIHETQLDKQKVFDVIDKKLTHYESNLNFELSNKVWQAMNKDRVRLLRELKEDLGL